MLGGKLFQATTIQNTEQATTYQNKRKLMRREKSAYNKQSVKTDMHDYPVGV